MTESWLVLKFGGTSVSGRAQWETIAALARQRLEGGDRVLLVCSALAGVTDALQGLAARPDRGGEDGLAVILQRHRRLADELGIGVEDLLAEAADQAARALAGLAGSADPGGRHALQASLLPVGEWLSTRIGERYLGAALPIEWVDAREALLALPEADASGRRARLSARCLAAADGSLQQKWLRKKPLLITQGFIAAHPDGGTALLGRGGSDTSAALLASRLQARHIEIWTDVPGLFTADPRAVPEARLLHQLGYEEALEMAASGAKVVHPRCIRAAADAGIPIRVLDLRRPAFPGTTIGRDQAPAGTAVEGVRAVCRQPNMAVLLLQNLDTREQVGFLAWVFAQISGMGISVDLVATSETTTTVALNRTINQLDDGALQALAERLRERCAVTLFDQCSSINLVGRGARVALADLDAGGRFFRDHPLLMLSQSANDLCISILLHSGDAQALLEALHGTLICRRAGALCESGVVGPSWREIESRW